MSEQATYTEHVYQEYAHGEHVEQLHQREEIVRCRDCRYRRAFEQPLNLERVCCGLRHSLYAVEDEGFCAWGERRES